MVRVTLTNHRRLTPELLISGIRALITVKVNSLSAIVSSRGTPSMVTSPEGATVDAWIKADPKIIEWHEATWKKAKNTEELLSAPLPLLANNPRFRDVSTFAETLFGRER
jgi:hypothetical protein